MKIKAAFYIIVGICAGPLLMYGCVQGLDGLSKIWPEELAMSDATGYIIRETFLYLLFAGCILLANFMIKVGVKEVPFRTLSNFISVWIAPIIGTFFIYRMSENNLSMGIAFGLITGFMAITRFYSLPKI